MLKEQMTQISNSIIKLTNENNRLKKQLQEAEFVIHSIIEIGEDKFAVEDAQGFAEIYNKKFTKR